MASDIRDAVEIMTIHRAVSLVSSNSAKFSYRDGWHGYECPSSCLLSVSCFGCQTHTADKFNTDKTSLDVLVASGHLNGQIGRRRPFLYHSATSRCPEDSVLIYSFLPTPHRRCPPILERVEVTQRSSLWFFADTRRATLGRACTALSLSATPGAHACPW